MEIEYITENYQPLVDLIQSSSHVYSTAEQVVGKWIDGHDMYEKTFARQLSGQSVEIDISDLDISFGMIVYGCYDNYGSFLPLNLYMGSLYTKTNLAPAIPYQYISCTNTFSNDTTVYITIRYTKSTQTRSLSAPVNTQKAQIEPLEEKGEETPVEEEKAVETPETEEENDER